MQKGNIEFTYNPETCIRTANYSGQIDDEILLAAFRGLIEAPDFIPIAHDLSDLRFAEDIGVTVNGLKALGTMMSAPTVGPRPEILPGLAIVTNSVYIFGLGRMYGMLTDEKLPKITKTFMDMEKAMTWLLSLPTPQKMKGSFND